MTIGSCPNADGSEELYDHAVDAKEWTNVVGRVEWSGVVQAHRRWLPAMEKEPVAGSAQRVLTYNRATDEATWEGKILRRTDAIP